MTNRMAGHRPDPRLRPRLIENILNVQQAIVEQGQGTVLFLAGEPGSGRSATLNAVGQRLNQRREKPLIVAGSFETGSYAPKGHDPNKWQRWLAQAGEALGLTAFVTDLFIGGPLVAILAQLAQLGAVSLDRGPGDRLFASESNPGMKFKAALRQAAATRPVVVLLDQIDRATDAGFLQDILSFSAPELLGTRPIFFIITLAGPQAISMEAAAKSATLSSAARLVRSGWASWYHLSNLNEEEIGQWLGNASPDLVRHLHQITSGNPEWLALLWNELWEGERVVLHPRTDRWQTAPGYETANLGTVWDIFERRLRHLLPDGDEQDWADAIYMLACATLEGKVFTPAAVGEVMGWDEDDIDELAHHDDQPYGLIEEAERHILGDGSKIWRYRFRSPLFWHTLQRYHLGTEERRALSLELAQSLERLYQFDHQPIAPVLATLFEQAGEQEQMYHYRAVAHTAQTVDALLPQVLLITEVKKSDWGQIEHMLLAGWLHQAFGRLWRRARPQHLEVLCRSMIESAKLADSPLWHGHALNNLGLTLRDHGGNRLGMKHFYQALTLLRQAGAVGGEAACLINIGSTYHNFGENDTALDYYNQGVSLMRQVGDQHGEAVALAGLGAVWLALGSKETALGYYHQALALFRLIGDRINEAANLTEIGNIYANLGEWDEARNYYHQALPIQQQEGVLAEEATTLHQLGVICGISGEFEEALSFYGQALFSLRKIGDQPREAATLNNIGSIHILLGEAETSLDFLNQAVNLWRQMGQHRVLHGALDSMASIYQQLGDLAQAEIHAAEAVAIAQSVGHPNFSRSKFQMNKE